MLRWLRASPGGSPAGAGRRRGAVPLRDHGAEAYWEARQRERDVVLPDGTTHARRTPAHWRRVALIVAHETDKRVGVDHRVGCCIDERSGLSAGYPTLTWFIGSHVHG